MNKELKVGQTVYWNDPDGGRCSDFGVVAGIRGEILDLEMCANGFVEALSSEVEIIEKEPWPL